MSFRDESTTNTDSKLSVLDHNIDESQEQSGIVPAAAPGAVEPPLEGEEKIEEESAGDGTTAQDQLLHGLPLFLCFVAAALCLFIYALDQTLVATILSTVGNQFGNFGKISWIVSGFMLPSAVLAMNWGKIAMIFGRKYTMLVAIFLFEAGSLIAALANSMNMLIGGRVLSGIGGGGVQVMVFMIITEIVPIQKRGMTQGILASVFGIASAVGPLIGGSLDKITWRWCFYINLPIGGAAAVAIWFLFNPPMPKGSLREKLAQIDYIGTFFLASGLVLLLLALTFGSTGTKWNSALVISFFTVGGALLIIYFVYNFTLSRHPMFPARVVKVPTVLSACLCLMFVFGGFLCVVTYLATYFQIVWNASALKSGIDLLPLILAVVLTSIIMGQTVSRTRITKPIAIAGTCICAVGMGLLTMLDEHSSVGKRIGYLIVPGIGVGSLFQTTTLSAQVAAPKSNGGILIAMSLVSFFRALGGVLGAAIGQTVQSVVFASKLKQVALPPNVLPTDLVNSPELIRKLPKELQEEVIHAFVEGFQKVMYFALGFVLAAAVCSLFLTNKKIPKANFVAKPAPPKDEEEKVASVEAETDSVENKEVSEGSTVERTSIA